MWRRLQQLFVVAAAVLVVLLVVMPRVGLAVLWNGVVPAAPALLVMAPGLFRNLCPLATVAVRRRARRPRLSAAQADVLRGLGVVLLWLVVPGRRVLFDHHGPATAALLVLVASLARLVGGHFEGRAWCSSLCPVHPVERLYGFAPLRTFTNARCVRCVGCTKDCPDLGRRHGPPAARWFERVMLGGFSGFVWGWFHVAPRPPSGLVEVLGAWGWPLGGAACSGLLFVLATRAGAERLFAAVTVTTYYWFRLPELAGPSSLTEWVVLRLAALVPGAWLLAGSTGKAWLFAPPLHCSEAADPFTQSDVVRGLGHEGGKAGVSSERVHSGPG